MTIKNFEVRKKDEWELVQGHDLTPLKVRTKDEVLTHFRVFYAHRKDTGIIRIVHENGWTEIKPGFEL